MGRAFILILGMLLSAGRGLADESPVLHLKLDEGEGTVARDSSGRGHDAELVNPQWEASGVRGKALRLNGTDAYVKLPKHKDFNLGNRFTFSIWFKAEEYKHGMSLFNRGNYQKGFQTYVFRSFVAFTSIPMANNKNSSAILYTRFAPGTRPAFPYTNLVITGAPAKEDGKCAIRYYINGKPVEDGRTKQTDFILNGSLPEPDAFLSIGDFASAEGRWFNGVIDEVKIYNRPLSPEEVAAEYQKTLKKETSGVVAVSSAAIPVVKLAPLKKTRIALYDAPAAYGKGVMPPEWFEKELTRLGLKVTRLDSKQLCDLQVLSPKNFDTLLLPVNILPFEAEYSVYKYLAAGGNLITAYCTPSMNRTDKDFKPLSDARGQLELKQHTRGWFAPFLIRRLPFPWARKKVEAPLTVHPAASAIVGDKLPAVFGPQPGLAYNLVDRWELQPAVAGREGDTDCTGGENYTLSGDIQLFLYNDPDGTGADFHVYRYYNRLIFGATLVELGNIGGKLLQGKDGASILEAVLHLAESRLPGEAAPSYYQKILRLNEEWSRLTWTWLDTVSRLRDAAFYTQLNKGDFSGFNRRIADSTVLYNTLTDRKKKQENLLNNRQAPSEIEPVVDALLADTGKAAAQFSRYAAEADKVLASAGKPDSPKIQSKYGRLPVVSYLTLPTNLSLFRERLFPTMKEIGCNIYSGSMHDWYIDDPVIQEQMKGIQRDLNFVYGAYRWLLPQSGEINPSNGTRKETSEWTAEPQKAEAFLKNLFEKWKGHRLFRIGVACETGIGFRYWGKQAEKDFQQYLKEQYKTIGELNRHWGTDWKDFSEIALPVRKPETPADHARWEHWRKLREKTFEKFYSDYYNIVRKQNRDIDIFGLVSTGSLNSPLYGVNFYEVTKYQDINGMDGTAVGPEKEWLFQDLTTKRSLTAEWGGLYQPQPLTYVNGKLLEELTGGALGFNLWLWQFGNGEADYVDYTGLPKAYGSLARMTIRDARKFEHIILDGRRADPEIGILFSQTTRAHDQAWGWRGENTFSPHVQAVINSYSYFLSHGRNARAVAEEMLLDGNLPPVKVLVVSQADYLSLDVQKKLLEFARAGGRLIIEGRAGRFDNFGMPSDFLFQSLGVVPAFVRAQTVSLGGKTFPLSPDDPVFSPSGKSTVLASFGKGPAAAVFPYGKGLVTVIGLNAGLKKSPVFQPLMKEILARTGVPDRFIVSDPNVLLREWNYGPDTYLMLTSRRPNWETFPVNVKIRGKCTVEDVLFKQNAGTSFRDGYTSFDTLLANGARIFRIPNGTPQPLGPPVILGQIASVSGEPAPVEGDKAAEEIKLPFKGRIYDDYPKMYKGYTIRASTISSGLDANLGETYLIVSRGSEFLKKRILLHRDSYFRMRDTILKVRASNHFYKFPFHTEVSIEEVKDVPPGMDAEIRSEAKNFLLENSLLKLAVDPSAGGRIVSMKPCDDLTEQLAEDSGKEPLTLAVSGGMPGPFADQTFRGDVSRDVDGTKHLKLVNEKSVAGKQLTQLYSIAPGTAGFSLSLKCLNTDQRMPDSVYDLRWHPELKIGGAADSADLFVLPVADGIKTMNFRASSTGISNPPAGDWAAVVDLNEKLAYVTAFNRKQVGRVYIWEAQKFYTLEIFAPHTKVPAGKSLDLDLSFYFLRGLTGLDAFSGGIGVQLDFKENVDQTLPAVFPVHVASAFEASRPVSLRASVARNGKTVCDFEKIDSYADCDRVLRHEFRTRFQSMDDGGCEFILTVKYADRPAVEVKKKLHFIGRELAELLKTYGRYNEELAACGNLPADKKFRLRVLLEEARSHIADGNLEKAKDGLAKFRSSAE